MGAKGEEEIGPAAGKPVVRLSNTATVRTLGSSSPGARATP